MTVNQDKTKVIIFNKGGKTIKRFCFTYSGDQIEIVNQYCYLGIVFTASGIFKYACDRLADLASKALFKLKSIHVRSNSIIAYKLFHSLITPILSYCCEVWCPFYMQNVTVDRFFDMCHTLPAERVYLKFGKYLLGVNKTATSAAVRGELGQTPLAIQLLSQATKYWNRLLTISPSSTVYNAYQEYLHNISDQNPRRPNWAKNIISVLECAGLTHLWERQESMPYSLFRHLKFTLSSLYERLWLDRINDPSKSPKLRTYIRFKQKFVMESYLISCLNYSHRKSFTKLRISAHPLCIETDRYKTPKVPADCKNHQVETEQHFLVSCPSLSDIWSDFLDSLRYFVDLDSLSAMNYSIS